MSLPSPLTDHHFDTVLKLCPFLVGKTTVSPYAIGEEFSLFIAEWHAQQSGTSTFCKEGPDGGARHIK